MAPAIAADEGLEEAAVTPSAAKQEEATSPMASPQLLPVTAVTFGAPRVGDSNFASKFGATTHAMPPCVPHAPILNAFAVWNRAFAWVARCSWSISTAGLDLENGVLWLVWTWAVFTVAWWLGSDALPALPFWQPDWTPYSTFVFLLFEAAWQLPWSLIAAAHWVYVRLWRWQSEDASAKACECQLQMLRVVNQGDAVPRVPLGIIFGGRWFRHGGVELRRSPYMLPELSRFQPAPFIGSMLGAPLGALHNLQVYLHLVDPTLDRAHMQKSDSVLIKECGLPACWYEPVLHKGMKLDKKTNRWIG